MENLNEINEDNTVTVTVGEEAMPTESKEEVIPLENNIQAKEKMFSVTFFLLLQGQFVSLIGDYIYEIALGFWVLATTGSTALMGTIMALSVLPVVIIGPFAGVIVDRCNRKALLILTDVIRGVCIVLIAVAAFFGFLKIWMAFFAAILLGICGAFYHPTTNSVIPEIIPKSRLTNGNSILGLATNSSNIIGNSLGGFLYSLVGAPLMFLINGLSFLFSGASIVFTKIPNNKNISSEQHFFTDLKSGLRFAWKLKSLRYLLFIVAALNFFGNISFVLILPLFQKTQSLGAARYGVAIAFFTAGMFLGMLVMSIIRVTSNKKFYTLIFGLFFSCVFFMTAFLVMNNFVIMCVMLLFGGFFNSIPIVLITSIIQAVIPRDMMGKVFALVSTISQGLMPIAYAIGGILGQFINIPNLIIASNLTCLLFIFPIAINKELKRFINFDPEKQVLEDII